MDVKTIVSLECPESAFPKPDGTLAREMVERRGFLCPHCHGSGQIYVEDGKGGYVRTQCGTCLGFGTLKVRVVTEWLPDERAV